MYKQFRCGVLCFTLTINDYGIVKLVYWTYFGIFFCYSNCVVNLN